MILGVDPGTTVAWALVDVDGRQLSVGSRKHFDLDSFIALCAREGKIVAVGTDKAKVPSFVHSVATKLGAILIAPSQDALVEEKRNLTNDCNFSNAHEMDALASAIIAQRKVLPLARKVRSFLDRENRQGLFDKVFEIVLKEGVSIRGALEIVEAPPELKKAEEESFEAPQSDLAKIHARVSRLQRDFNAVCAQRDAFERKLKSFESQNEALREKMDGLVRPKSKQEMLSLKERQLVAFSGRIKSLEAKLESEKIRSSRIQGLFLDENFIAIPIVNQKGPLPSIVFLESVKGLTPMTARRLKDRGVEIVVSKESSRARLPIAVVEAKSVHLFSAVAFVSREFIENVRARRSVLLKMVEEYQNERLS